MATSIKEIERQKKREQFAKEFSKVYKKPSLNVSTYVKWDGTPKYY